MKLSEYTRTNRNSSLPPEQTTTLTFKTPQKNTGKMSETSTTSNTTSDTTLSSSESTEQLDNPIRDDIAPGYVFRHSLLMVCISIGRF
jgi:hypothetical protein